MSLSDGPQSWRSDALRNRERILDAAERLLKQLPDASLADIAVAAGVSRSTLHRRFSNRVQLLEALKDRYTEPQSGTSDPAVPVGRLGRERPLSLDAIRVFDVVPPAALPDQLVAEAERVAKVPVALYLIDIDGTSLLHIAGHKKLAAMISTPLAVGPELDADGLAELRKSLSGVPAAEVFPLWLRGRASGVFITFGQAAEPLTELARQAAAAITLADRYTDVFACAQRSRQATAAAELQQSLLPPRISRVTGGEVAGNVLPSYEVGGDWFDVTENADSIWITIADGLGGRTRAAASSAVALGALRASRRGGAGVNEALIVMHETLREMPGPRSEMTVVATQWDPATGKLVFANAGHIPPIVIRGNGTPELLKSRATRGLGGRSTPKPAKVTTNLATGDRLILVSDGVARQGAALTELGWIFDAALRSDRATAADTVREIHGSILKKAGKHLSHDATVVCLAVL